MYIVIKTKSTVFFSLHKSKTFLALKMKHEKKKALQKKNKKKNQQNLKIVMFLGPSATTNHGKRFTD